MEQPRMSSSRLRVILGTMEFGRQSLTQPEPCHELMDAFVSKGHREIDTALAYVQGTSEKYIGLYPDLTKVSIATKANPWGDGLNCASVLQQMETSLAHLGVSCVDLFYLHAPDHKTPIEETLSACQQLFQEGKFKELGLSNFASWQVADVYHVCKKNGWVLPTVYQGMYNPITRMVESELFPALRYFGLRFYAYNPLAGGLLSGRYSLADMNKQSEGRFWTVGGHWAKKYRERFWRESTFQGIELVRGALDKAYGAGKVSLVSAAFRWLNHHSLMQPEYNDGIILGGSRKDHLLANTSACEEGPLEESVVKAFDEAWQLDKAHCAKYYR